MSSLRYYPIVVVGASAALLGYAVLSRKSKKSAEQMEYERRTELTQGGRIIDGNIIDVHELEDDETERQMILLVYSYDVAGVTYEASQDVTHLRQFIDLVLLPPGTAGFGAVRSAQSRGLDCDIGNMVWIAETSDSS